MSNKLKVMGHMTSIPKVVTDAKNSYIIIPKEYAIRMYALFGDIESMLDENKTIVPDSDAAKGHGCNPSIEGEEYSIHQRVSWMVTGYGCFIGDNTDWKI